MSFDTVPPRRPRIIHDALDAHLGTVQLVRPNCSDRPDPRGPRALRFYAVLIYRESQKLTPQQRAELAEQLYQSQGRRPWAWPTN